MFCKLAANFDRLDRKDEVQDCFEFLFRATMLDDIQFNNMPRQVGCEYGLHCCC